MTADVAARPAPKRGGCRRRLIEGSPHVGADRRNCQCRQPSRSEQDFPHAPPPGDDQRSSMQRLFLERCSSPATSAADLRKSKRPDQGGLVPRPWVCHSLIAARTDVSLRRAPACSPSDCRGRRAAWRGPRLPRNSFAPALRRASPNSASAGDRVARRSIAVPWVPHRDRCWTGARPARILRSPRCTGRHGPMRCPDSTRR